MYYYYSCNKCGAEEEKTHGMNDTPIYNCPKCGAIMKRLIFGGSGTHYKGVGWSSNNTALSPKPTRYAVKELRGPKFLSRAIRN